MSRTVTLSWDCAAYRVIVSVVHAATGESFELTADDANARDADVVGTRELGIVGRLPPRPAGGERHRADR